MEFIKNVILARLKEQSTWVGIVTLVSSLGVSMSPDQTAAIATLGASLAGAIMVFWPEKKIVVTDTTKTETK